MTFDICSEEFSQFLRQQQKLATLLLFRVTVCSVYRCTESKKMLKKGSGWLSQGTVKPIEVESANYQHPTRDFKTEQTDLTLPTVETDQSQLANPT